MWKTVRTKNLVTVGLLGVLCAVAQASEYKSTKGFRINYPDSWQIVTRSQAKGVSAVARKMTPTITDLHMDVMIYNPWHTGENINVIVYPGSLPINSSSLPEARESIRSEITSVGITPEGLDCQIAHLGKTTALKSTWATTMPKLGAAKIQQEQWILSARGHIYIITCSAHADQKDAAATFEKVVSSFQLQSES